MKIPTFETGPSGDDVLLLCPHCGSNYMHQTTVRLYERNGDDKDGAVIVVKGPNDLHVTKAETNELIGRRQALTIEFSCEGCTGETVTNPRLLVKQHKGQTMLSWVSE